MIACERPEAFPYLSSKLWRPYPTRCWPRGARTRHLQMPSPRAGFRGQANTAPAFDGVISEASFWLEVDPVTGGKRALRERLAQAYAIADRWRAELSEDERRAADYLLVKNCGFPAYMAGAFSSAALGI
jgi:hypothetical protein